RSDRGARKVNEGPDPELLAIVVHELRSPVAALAAISDAFRRGSQDEANRRELVRLTIAACNGIARTTADANVGFVRLERVDVGPIVADAVAAARLLGADARSEIEVGLACADADPERIRQAFDNLLANAMTHAEGSPITVAARTVGEHIVVSVSDRGEGIAPADQARIFEPGARLEPSRPGVGLG